MDQNPMPAQPQQELNIDDLLSKERSDEIKMQSELKKEQMKAKQKIISPIPILRDLPNKAANDEQASEEQRDKESAKQSLAATPQETQNQESEEEIEKTRPWEIKKRKQIRKKIGELEKKLKEIEKKAGKYQTTNFTLLIFLASFVDLSDMIINFLWATLVLIPLAIPFMLIKQMACAFIWIKIHKISKEQETGETFAITLITFITELIPLISELPATVVRTIKARSAAKKKFEENKDEMEKIIKEIDKFIKQLG